MPDICTVCLGMSPTVAQLDLQLLKRGDPSGACHHCNNTHEEPMRRHRCVKHGLTEYTEPNRNGDSYCTKCMPRIVYITGAKKPLGELTAADVPRGLDQDDFVED